MAIRSLQFLHQPVYHMHVELKNERSSNEDEEREEEENTQGTHKQSA